MRVGIFAAGAMGKKHLESWRALGVPVAGVYARDIEKARALAAPYNVAAYDSISSLLAEVEIADICLPTFLHQEVVEPAAQAGCQIVCEKPLALDPAGGEAIFRACDGANVRFFLAMVVRFFPPYRAAWEAVRGGALGTIEEIALKRIVNTPLVDKPWFGDEALSGGVILDLLIHDIDYALWLAGPAVKVHARLERKGLSHSAYLILEHAGGATSRIEGGWLESATGLDTAIHLAGSSARIDIAAGLPFPFPNLPAKDPYVEQLRHFQTALENNTPFEVTRQEALHALRVATAAQESSREGRPVTLASDPNPVRG
jgi:predicted dehydrogenase